MTAPNHDSPVLSIGEFLIDLIAASDSTSLLDADTLAVRPGGAPANVAVALARQGVPAALCAVVGADPFGERLLGVLDRNQVDRSRVRQDPESDTTLAFAWKDDRGDGHFWLLRQADVRLDVADIMAARIPDASAIVVGSVSLSRQPARRAIEKAVEIAVDAGVAVCFDVNMRPTIWPNRQTAWEACEPILPSATLLKLSLDDARFLLEIDQRAGAKEVVHELSWFGNDVIVLTDGARGSWFSNWLGTHHAAPRHVPAFDVEAVEPTGAGDAFMGSLIARLLENEWDDISALDMRYASAAGALTTMRPGAIDSLPTRAEIDAFLATHPS